MTEEELKKAWGDILRRALESPTRCGTPYVYAVHDAVEAFRNGRPVGDRITVDEVVMRVYDDWKLTGQMSNDTEERDIYAPLVSVEGGNGTERLEMDTDIEGFTPIRGHEYRLKVRRIYLTGKPHYHHYELLELMSDTIKEQ